VRRRGAAADAVLLNPERTHRKGLAAFRKAGGRVVESVSSATDLVIDGVVGISGSGPLPAGGGPLANDRGAPRNVKRPFAGYERSAIWCAKAVGGFTTSDESGEQSFLGRSPSW
jgi:hypothetical protein